MRQIFSCVYLRGGSRVHHGRIAGLGVVTQGQAGHGLQGERTWKYAETSPVFIKQAVDIGQNSSEKAL